MEKKKKTMVDRHTWTSEEISEIRKIYKDCLKERNHNKYGKERIEEGMKESKRKGGVIWKLKMHKIKAKISWLRLAKSRLEKSRKLIRV